METRRELLLSSFNEIEGVSLRSSLPIPSKGRVESPLGSCRVRGVNVLFCSQEFMFAQSMDSTCVEQIQEFMEESIKGGSP